MDIIPYNHKLKEHSRELRKNSTLAEVLLWNRLKGKQIRGYQFLRQKPIGNYILDFYCKELKLAIEVDGQIHRLKIEADTFRQGQLESFGITFLRFSNNQVEKDIDNVIGKINKATTSLGLRPLPSKGD
ncbi:DUF559 domain-containing protein [Candidatus Parcubacteria bacterium]|nr:DUF559 domain-containing protein [Candidatus Parcubacteria bacterium]